MIPHTTGLMKKDPEMGVQALSPLYKQGRIRLPGKNSNNHLQAFIEQHLHWPMGKYDDQVMADWFVEAQWDNVSIKINRAPALWRPTWMKESERGLRVGT